MGSVLRRWPLLVCVIALAPLVVNSVRSFLPGPERVIAELPQVRDATDVPAPGSPILLRATGHQLFWHFCFAGSDRQFGTSDDLLVDKVVHLPSDSDIQVSVESDDFVYSFSAPGLKVRQIAVPELTYALEMHTTQLGQFALIADPFCGVRIFHDEDMGRIVVQSRAQFEAWYHSKYSRKSST